MASVKNWPRSLLQRRLSYAYLAVDVHVTSGEAAGNRSKAGRVWFRLSLFLSALVREGRASWELVRFWFSRTRARVARDANRIRMPIMNVAAMRISACVSRAISSAS